MEPIAVLPRALLDAYAAFHIHARALFDVLNAQHRAGHLRASAEDVAAIQTATDAFNAIGAESRRANATVAERQAWLKTVHTALDRRASQAIDLNINLAPKGRMLKAVTRNAQGQVEMVIETPINDDPVKGE